MGLTVLNLNPLISLVVTCRCVFVLAAGAAAGCDRGRFRHLHQSVSRLRVTAADGRQIPLPLHSEHLLWTQRCSDIHAHVGWTMTLISSLYHECLLFSQSRVEWGTSSRGVQSSWISTGKWRACSPQLAEVVRLVHWRNCSLTNTHSVVIYSLSCSSKLVWLSFLCVALKQNVPAAL